MIVANVAVTDLPEQGDRLLARSSSKRCAVESDLGEAVKKDLGCTCRQLRQWQAYRTWDVAAIICFLRQDVDHNQ